LPECLGQECIRLFYLTQISHACLVWKTVSLELQL